MLSGYAKREWGAILVIGMLLATAFLIWGPWPLAVLGGIVTVGMLLFFRDPNRQVPTQRGAMVSPADGRISSIHRVEHFEPFGEPAICVRIFMSLLDVHVNRSPCHGVVQSITHKSGKHLNVLNPDSAEVNESCLTVLLHPIRHHPIAAVRQVAGLIARTIVCGAHEGQVLQRGQRMGIIKFGSTVELYVPECANPQVLVRQGQYVRGGNTVLANVLAADPKKAADDQSSEPQKSAQVSEV